MYGNIFQDVQYRLQLNECHAPLALRSVGAAKMERRAATVKRETDFFQLIWTEQGEGKVRIRNDHWRVPVEHVVLCPPGSGHQLAVSDSFWAYRWITFDGVAAGVMMSAFAFPRKAFKVGICPGDRFVELAEMLIQPGRAAELAAGARTYQLLSELAWAPSFSDEMRKKNEINLPDFNPDDPDLSVNTLADQAGVSRFTVIRAFQKEFGMSPKRYIDAMRLRKALALLHEERWSIVEIAEMTGFANGNYFAKFFRNATGMSPTEFLAAEVRKEKVSR